MLIGRRHGLAGLLLTLLVASLVSHSATAQDRLVVTEFQNDEGRRFEDLIIDELLFRGDYQLVSYESFLDEVDAYGLRVNEFLQDPALVVELADELDFTAVVHGRLDRERRPRELLLSVYEGASGLVMGRVTIGVRQGQLDDVDLEDRLFELEELIELAEPLPPPEPEPVTRSDPPRRETGTSTPSTLGLEAHDQPNRTGWLRVEGGLDVMMRSFTVVSAEQGIQYDSGFYPGLEGTIEIFPVKLAKPGVLDGLGVQLRVARYFVDTVLVLEELGQDLDIPTRHKELGVALIYQHPFGPFQLDAKVGYESLAFTLGANSVYQSSEYGSVVIGVGGRYAILRDLLLAGASFELRPAPALGDAELEAFGDASSFGFAFAVGIEVTPIERVLIAGQYRYLRYNTTFDGGGTSGMTGQLDATDSYNMLALRASYAF